MVNIICSALQRSFNAFDLFSFSSRRTEFDGSGGAIEWTCYDT